MKSTTKVLILGQVVDVGLTVYAVGTGQAVEGNPLVLNYPVFMSFYKLFILIIACLYLENIDTNDWFVWLLPISAWIPAVWNIMQILLYLLGI